MRSFLSERAKNTERSAIREILKYTQEPEVISFAGGLPKPETFPREGLAESAASQIRDNYEKSLQYGTTEGIKEFRQEMSSWLSEFGLELELKNIIATNSSQQAIDLVSKTFLDPGDRIFCGLPTYLGAVQAFSTFQAEKVGIPLEKDGMNLEILEKKIKDSKSSGRRAKFIYVIPDFQNPTGVTLSKKKRKKILDIAEEHDLLIIEDTPYFGVRFSKGFKKPIGTYDDNGRVITIASLSKILSSGMRLAVVGGPSELLANLVTMKQSTDLCTSTTTQWIAADWLKNNNLSDHLKELRKYYRENRDAMIEEMNRSFPKDEGISWTEPNGGLFIWVTLPEGMDSESVFEKGLENNVAFVPGHHFYVNGGGQNTMRLSYSLLNPEKIREGINRLGKVLEKELSPISQ
ncbi:PLP-dependent aminotransferase family protein [Candidatus Bipolaricaulota bacterium]|nr:PLP-dependent aminotransferase family protein [Candidatus Bipolaricaulota bacterium]